MSTDTHLHGRRGFDGLRPGLHRSQVGRHGAGWGRWSRNGHWVECLRPCTSPEWTPLQLVERPAELQELVKRVVVPDVDEVAHEEVPVGRPVVQVRRATPNRQLLARDESEESTEEG